MIVWLEEALRTSRDDFVAYNDLMDSEDDILPEEDYVPKPHKNLFRKWYSEPVFPVRKCARSKLRKITGRLSRKSVV